MGDGPRRRSGEGLAGGRLDDALTAQAARRDFLLGESGPLRYAEPTARLHGHGAHSIGNPWTAPHRRTVLDRERTLDGPQGASPSTRPRTATLIAPR